MQWQNQFPSIIRTGKISPKISFHFQVLDALWAYDSNLVQFVTGSNTTTSLKLQTGKNSQPNLTNGKSYFQRNIVADLLVLYLKYTWSILRNELLSMHSKIWIFFSHKSQLFHKSIHLHITTQGQPLCWMISQSRNTCDSH